MSPYRPFHRANTAPTNRSIGRPDVFPKASCEVGDKVLDLHELKRTTAALAVRLITQLGCFWAVHMVVAQLAVDLLDLVDLTARELVSDGLAIDAKERGNLEVRLATSVEGGNFS